MISKKEKNYFRVAKVVSDMSDHRYKLGCVVVKNHHIISSGYNSQTKCHAKQALADMEYFGEQSKGPIHAEFKALNYLINQHVDLSNASLYLYREHKNGELALAKPCPRCMKLIESCGIKKIRYTGNNSYIYEYLKY